MLLHFVFVVQTRRDKEAIIPANSEDESEVLGRKSSDGMKGEIDYKVAQGGSTLTPFRVEIKGRLRST